MELAALRQAIEAAAGLVPEQAEVRARGLADEAARRAASPPGTPLVVLVGGTGSGKSSLLNALAGTPIAAAGLVRPTTDAPLAWVPDTLDDATSSVLSGLGVMERRADPPAPGWVVVDLPDTDSYREDHAHVAEWVVPRAEVVVWVTDPVKYHDARTLELLSALRPGLDGVVIALNKVDAVPPARVPDVRVALEALARGAGWDGMVHPVAAAPMDGHPIGVEDLRRGITAAVDEGAYDPTSHLAAAAARVLREAVPDELLGLEPWDAVERRIVPTLAGLLAPDRTGDAMQSLGRSVAAGAAGGAAGILAHRVVRGPVGSARVAATKEVERGLDDWRGDGRRVSLEADLESLLFGLPSHDSSVATGQAVDDALSGAVDDAVERLEVAPRGWWPVGRVLGWVAPGAVLLGLVMAVLGVVAGAMVAGVGAAVAVLVAVLALRSGSASGDGAGRAYEETVVDAALGRLRGSVGAPYGAVADRAEILRATLPGSTGSPYT